ncbi:MAG: hypothetical protein AAGJ87_01605 [Pseudomonadota bacterium]
MTAWSRLLDIADLPADGASVTLVADEAARVAVAQRLNIPAVHDLRGAIEARAHADGADISGRLTATLGRRCVASLDLINEEIDEPFSVAYRRAPEFAREDEDFVFGDDDVETLETDVVDLADLLVQQTALAMAAFPRKDGATGLVEQYGDGGSISPFAVLQGKINERPENKED